MHEIVAHNQKKLEFRVVVDENMSFYFFIVHSKNIRAFASTAYNCKYNELFLVKGTKRETHIGVARCLTLN